MKRSDKEYTHVRENQTSAVSNLLPYPSISPHINTKCTQWQLVVPKKNVGTLLGHAGIGSARKFRCPMGASLAPAAGMRCCTRWFGGPVTSPPQAYSGPPRHSKRQYRSMGQVARIQPSAAYFAHPTVWFSPSRSFWRERTEQVAREMKGDSKIAPHVFLVNALFSVSTSFLRKRKDFSSEHTNNL